MKFRAIWCGVLAAIILLGTIGLAKADDPPQSGEGKPEISPTESPTSKGDFATTPIESGHQVFDPTTARVIYLEPDKDNQALTPASAPTPTTSADSDPFAPGPLLLGATQEGKLQLSPDSAGMASDLSRRRHAPGGEVGTAATTTVTRLTFETNFTPGGGWNRLSSNAYAWDDVPCFPVETGGVGAAWAADLSDRNPCAPDFDNYPPDVDTWLIYGPFSLTGAQASTLDFYFRLVSQSCDPITACDYLFWGASVNGTDFFGQFAAGTHNAGYYNNGYNFASLNLAEVPVLGDLTGRSQVWVGFRFKSNSDPFTAQGPFLDDIALYKNTDARVYLIDESFDFEDFPNSLWETFDFANAGVRWNDVPCFARSGDWAMWPAASGPGARNPCAGAGYANNMYSWLIYGPVNLQGASEAWVDFYFRNESEPGVDNLFWGASIDNNTFYGFSDSGTHINGPHRNGYNFVRFYLSNVPTLVDLRGEPQVWLTFIFESNGSIVNRGAFVDDVQVIVEKEVVDEVFLPVLIKNPPPVKPKTSLYINNQTGKLINNYTVLNPTLNGVPQPNAVCRNIPAGATNYNCGLTFDTGTYQVSSTNGCNPPVTSGQVTFKTGPDVRLVRCR